MIRTYAPEDKAELLELLRRNTPQYFAPAEEADFLLYLEEHLEDYFVVENAGQIIGCGGLNYFPEAGLARISWDIIHPDFQGKGIGRELLSHRIDVARGNPAIRLLQVRTTQLVYQFYEKMGFELEKVERDFWADGFDLYQMRLPLR